MLSRLFQLVQFVKCWQIFLELNSKRLYQSSGKEEESRCLVFMSSTKHEIGHFHVVAVHKKGDARTKLLFCYCKPIAFLPFSLPSPPSLPKLPNVLHLHRTAFRVGTIIYSWFSVSRHSKLIKIKIKTVQ